MIDLQLSVLKASSGADVDVYGSPTDVQSDKSSGGSVSIRG